MVMHGGSSIVQYLLWALVRIMFSFAFVGPTCVFDSRYRTNHTFCGLRFASHDVRDDGVSFVFLLSQEVIDIVTKSKRYPNTINDFNIDVVPMATNSVELKKVNALLFQPGLPKKLLHCRRSETKIAKYQYSNCRISMP